MQTRTLTIALLTAGAWFPAPSRAADDFSPQWLMYSVNQVCQVWANGIARCFPVAMVSPAPAYANRGLEPLMPATGTPQPVPDNTHLASAAQPTTPAPAAPAPAPVQATPAVPAAAPAKMEDALAHFEFDRAELTEAGRSVLDAWLVRTPKGIPARVTGHADRLGSSAYNLTLSRRRAESVARYLTDKGMRPNDIRLAAKGENVPVVTCRGGPTPATKDCLAPNRRVEIDPE